MRRVTIITTAVLALILVALLYGGYVSNGESAVEKPAEPSQIIDLYNSDSTFNSLKMSPRLSGVKGERVPEKPVATDPPRKPRLGYLFLLVTALIGLITGKYLWTPRFIGSSQSSTLMQPPWDKETNTELLPEVKAQKLAFQGLDERHEALQEELNEKDGVIGTLKQELAIASDKQSTINADQEKTILDLKSELEKLLKSNTDLEEREKTHSLEHQKVEQSLTGKYEKLGKELASAETLAEELISEKERVSKKLGHEITDLEQKLQESQSSVGSRDEELEELRTTSNNKEESLRQELTRNISTANEQRMSMEDLHQQIANFNQEIEESNESAKTRDAENASELAQRQEEIESLKQSLGLVKKDASEQTEKRSDQDGVLEELRKQIDHLNQDIDKSNQLAGTRDTQSTAELAKRQEEIESLKHLLETVNSEASEKSIQHEATINGLMAQTEAFKGDLADSNDHIETLSRDHAAGLGAKDEEIGVLSESVKKLSQQHDEREKDTTLLTAEIARLTRNLESSQAEHLEKAAAKDLNLSQLAAQIEALKRNLDATRNSHNQQLNQLSTKDSLLVQLTSEVNTLKQDLAKASGNNVVQQTHLNELEDITEAQKTEIRRLESGIQQKTGEIEKQAGKIVNQVDQISRFEEHATESAQREDEAQVWLQRADVAENALSIAREELLSVKEAGENISQELTVARQQISDLNDTLKKSQHEVGLLNAVNGEHEATLSSFFSQLTEITYKSEALPLEFNPQNKVEDALVELPDLATPLEELDGMLLGLETRNKHWALEAQEWRSRAENAESQALTSIRELDLLRANSETVDTDLESSKIKLVKLSETLAQRERDLEQVSNRFGQRESVISEFQANLCKISNKAEAISIVVPEPDSTLANETPPTDLTPQLEKLEDSLNNLEAQKTRWFNDAKQWHERAGSAETKLDSTQNELDNLRETHQHVLDELETSGKTLEKLRDNMTNSQHTLEQLSADSTVHKNNVAGYISSLTNVANKVNSLTITPPSFGTLNKSLLAQPADVSAPFDELDELLAALEEQRISTSQESQQWLTRAEDAESNLTKTGDELTALQESSEKTLRALAASRKELTAARDVIKQRELELENAAQNTSQEDVSAIRYLALLSRSANRIDSVQLPVMSGSDTGPEITSEEPRDLTPSLDALDNALAELGSGLATATSINNGQSSEHVAKLEKDVQSHQVMIKRLKRGIDKLRHYQTKVKNWDNTISGYRSDIKQKTQLIDGLRDENTRLRKLEIVVTEREKSIATLVTALKHDASHIAKLKRRLGRWKRRSVMLEGRLETHAGKSAIPDPTEVLEADTVRIKQLELAPDDPKQSKSNDQNVGKIELEVKAGPKVAAKSPSPDPITLAVDRDRPKGQMPLWVKKQQSGKPRDDLTKISGIDEMLAETVFQVGISSYEQLANFSENDVEWLAYLIDAFPTKVLRGKWVEQARELVAARSLEASPG